MKAAIKLLVLLVCTAFVWLMAWSFLQLPPARVKLDEQVLAQLRLSGVEHPVTAVLLNFRGYDTLLEIAVLLLALIGVLASHGGHNTAHRIGGSLQPVLQSMTSLVVPLMILAAGYLLWAGSHRPGGAFQAGAVLGAAAVLLYLAGIMRAWPAPGRLLRLGLIAGFAIFLAVAAGVMSQGALLQYPLQLAGPLILLIETSLMFSLGLILAGLFLWLPNENEEEEE